jgi:hypothetical protein
LKHCSSCGREIAESLTLCEQCERWAEDPVGAPAVDAAPSNLPPPAGVAPPAPVVAVPPVRAAVAVPPAPAVRAAVAVPPAPAVRAAVAASPASGRRLGRRELLVILVAVVGGGIITFALISTRGPAAEVAAARVEAPARKPSAPSAPPAAAATQKWGSDNRAHWLGNERHAAAFELPAENTVPIWMNQVRPMLVVRCAAKRTEVFVSTGSALMMEPNTEDHTVTFRFDDEPERTERWPDSADHDALFTPDGAAFARRVISARTMRFGYTPHNAAPVVARFEVSGLGELVEAFAKECGWNK